MKEWIIKEELMFMLCAYYVKHMFVYYGKEVMIRGKDF